MLRKKDTHTIKNELHQRLHNNWNCIRLLNRKSRHVVDFNLREEYDFSTERSLIQITDDIGFEIRRINKLKK